MAENRSGLGGRSRSLGVVIATLVAVGVVAGVARAWAEGLVVPGADQSVEPCAQGGRRVRISATAVVHRQSLLRDRHVCSPGFRPAGIVQPGMRTDAR